MSTTDKKRKSDTDPAGSISKMPKQWRTPKKGQQIYVAPTIEAGDAGIWATCEMGKEGKCTGELRDLFEDYATKIYGLSSAKGNDEASDGEDAEADIEADIRKELKDIKAKSTRKEALFQAVKIDVQCVLFFRTRPPIEPVSFVRAICKDAFEGGVKRGRWIKKLTPMSKMGKATPEGLQKVADEVLGPVFHADNGGEKKELKFAIRPTRRNHNVMKREDIIKQVAATVGKQHRVDLKNYDHLILVDVYRSILGMSVVGSDFEGLKQYNLAEIFDPTPKPVIDGGAAPSSKENPNPNPEANKNKDDASVADTNRHNEIVDELGERQTKPTQEQG